MPSKTVKPGHKLKVERETNKSSKSIDPYSCAIKIKHQYGTIAISLWKKVVILLDISP